MSGFAALAIIASSVAIALPASAISFNLSFTTDTDNGGDPLTVNALLATSDSSPTAIPNNTYTVTGITGFANSNPITGLNNTFGNPDNIFQWDGTTIIGLTGQGISFNTASSSINIYNFDTGSITEFNLSSLFATSTNNDGGFVTSLSLTPDATPVPFDFDPSFGLLALGGAWTARKMIKKSKSVVNK